MWWYAHFWWWYAYPSMCFSVLSLIVYHCKCFILTKIPNTNTHTVTTSKGSGISNVVVWGLQRLCDGRNWRGLIAPAYLRLLVILVPATHLKKSLRHHHSGFILQTYNLLCMFFMSIFYSHLDIGTRTLPA